MQAKENYNYKDLKRALKVKRRRLYKHILNMLKNGECLFITMTFSDESFNKLDEIKRERNIRTFLSNQCCDYVFNKDYGKETNREHYHALVRPKYKNTIYSRAYHMGFIHIERLNKSKRFLKNDDTKEDIALRLLEHATKNSTDNAPIHIGRINNKPIGTYYKKKIDELIIKSQLNKKDYYFNRRTKTIKKSNDELMKKILSIYNLY